MALFPLYSKKIIIGVFGAIVTSILIGFAYDPARTFLTESSEDKVIAELIQNNENESFKSKRQKQVVLFDFESYSHDLKTGGLMGGSFGFLFARLGVNDNLGQKDKQQIQDKCLSILEGHYPSIKDSKYSGSPKNFVASNDAKIVGSISKSFPYTINYTDQETATYASMRMVGECKGTEYIVDYEDNSYCPVVFTKDTISIRHQGDVDDDAKEPVTITSGTTVNAPWTYLQLVNIPDRIVISSGYWHDANLLDPEGRHKRLNYYEFFAADAKIDNCRGVSPKEKRYADYPFLPVKSELLLYANY